MRTQVWALLMSLLAGACMAAPAAPSIYDLDARLTNQSGARHGLDVYRGKPVLVAMFYGSCPNACPLLIDTMRRTEKAVPARERTHLRVLLISIDPQNDTPQALRALAQTHQIDLTRWTLATTDAATVRKIAAVLNVQYRQSADGDFNHSSIVTLLSPDGAILEQSSMLGKVDPALVRRLAPNVPAHETAAAGTARR